MKSLILIFIILGFSSNSWSQKKLSNAGLAGFSKFGGVFDSYSGDKNKSFSDGATGFGGEIAVDAGLKYLRYYAKIKISTADGSQSFLDGTIETKANFTLLQVSPEMGLSFYPVGRNDKGVNLYVYGGGLFAMNSLQLKPISIVSTGAKVTTFTKLATSQQGFGFGYSAGIGFEIIFGSKKTSKYMIYGEGGIKQSTADLNNNGAFQVNSLFFALGIGI